MKLNNLKINLFVVFTLIILPGVNAQNKVWMMDIPTIEISGYYNLELDQKVLPSYNERGFKILDDESREVPYFLRPVSPVEEKSEFVTYPLVQNDTKDSLNIIVIDNSLKEAIDRFYIVIRNADVSKYTTVRGSDDGKQWYIVGQKSTATNFNNYQNNDQMLVVDFPQGNYKYYEVKIENTQNSPLEVVKVGKVKNSNTYAQYTELDLGRFVQTEDKETRRTLVSFPKLEYDYSIDKIKFFVNGKMHYLRTASISNSGNSILQQFNLSSKQSNEFIFSRTVFNANTQIYIDNASNPPLVIDSIKVYGLKRYLCAYLETGKSYYTQGIADGENVRTEDYDIEHFKNEIATDLPFLSPNKVYRMDTPEAPKRELSLIEQPLFLWGMIVIVGLFIIYICIRMLREVKKRES